jgi:hypothetical protein
MYFYFLNTYIRGLWYDSEITGKNTTESHAA